MKKFIIFNKALLFIFFISAGIVLAELTIEYFTARTNSNGILVEWKTGNEGSTAKFELERSAASPDNFIYIATINARGNNSYYSFQDNSVDINSSNQSNSIYYYRLKCINSNGSHTYGNVISVIHSVSGIRSTWGSIKAIFR